MLPILRKFLLISAVLIVLQGIASAHGPVAFRRGQIGFNQGFRQGFYGGIGFRQPFIGFRQPFIGFRQPIIYGQPIIGGQQIIGGCNGFSQGFNQSFSFGY